MRAHVRACRASALTARVACSAAVSDGKITHLQLYTHPRIEGAVPHSGDGQWAQARDWVEIAAGVQTSAADVPVTARIEIEPTKTRWLKLHCRNDGRHGYAGYIELRQLMAFEHAEDSADADEHSGFEHGHPRSGSQPEVEALVPEPEHVGVDTPAVSMRSALLRLKSAMPSLVCALLGSEVSAAALQSVQHAYATTGELDLTSHELRHLSAQGLRELTSLCPAPSAIFISRARGCERREMQRLLTDMRRAAPLRLRVALLGLEVAPLDLDVLSAALARHPFPILLFPCLHLSHLFHPHFACTRPSFVVDSSVWSRMRTSRCMSHAHVF